MHRQTILAIAALVFLPLSSCTSISVQPINRSANLKHICIHENVMVVDDSLLTALKAGFNRHHISTQVFTGNPPIGCEYILTYTALWSIDFATYLSDAEIGIKHKGNIIASAKYRLRGDGGGLSLMKWQDTKTKIDPVIDALLRAYP